MSGTGKEIIHCWHWHCNSPEFDPRLRPPQWGHHLYRTLVQHHQATAACSFDLDISPWPCVRTAFIRASQLGVWQENHHDIDVRDIHSFRTSLCGGTQWPALLVFRLVAAISASSPIAVVGGMFADVYDDSVTRGRAMALFMAASLLTRCRKRVADNFLGH